MTKVDSVLDVLENESIEIFRQAPAAFRKPVMLYSKGATRLIDGERNHSMEKKTTEGCF